MTKPCKKCGNLSLTLRNGACDLCQKAVTLDGSISVAIWVVLLSLIVWFNWRG